MPQYLLDTNICIHLLRGSFGIAEKLRNIGWDNCAISEITIAELKVGENIMKRRGMRFIPLELTPLSTLPVYTISSALLMYADEKCRLQFNGTPQHDDFDLLIGCTAVANGLTLVTENIKHFSAINGIVLENWIKRD